MTKRQWLAGSLVVTAATVLGVTLGHAAKPPAQPKAATKTPATVGKTTEAAVASPDVLEGYRTGKLKRIFPPISGPLRSGRVPRYRGIGVSETNEAAGDDLKVQKAFAAALEKADPVVPARLAYFGLKDAPGIKLMGWGAKVVKVTPNAAGYEVTVGVIPEVRFDGNTRSHFVPGPYYETYQYADGNVRLLGAHADGPPGEPFLGVH